MFEGVPTLNTQLRRLSFFVLLALLLAPASSSAQDSAPDSLSLASIDAKIASRQFKSAADRANARLTMIATTNDSLEIAETLDRWVYSFDRAGGDREPIALERAQLALGIRQRHDSAASIAWLASLRNLAALYRKLGEYQKAQIGRAHV